MHKYSQLLLGILIGAVFMFLCLGPAEELSSTTLTTSLRSVQQQQPPKDETSSIDGWHKIHVFYGEKAGLGADPNPDAWFGQVHQDEIAMDLIGPNGYFLDLAANDAAKWTNTLALERHGWKGLCFEPNPGYWYGLAHRECTVVGALVGGTHQQKVQVKFRGVFGGMVGKLDERLANRKKEPDAPLEDRYTTPIRQVLSQFQAPHVIDYLSLDVEGMEYMIMEDFPFDEYTIRLLTIERPSQPLKKLMEDNGYLFLKQLAWWGETLWAHESTGLTPEHPKIVKIQTEERN
jgi:hypothetical protein